MKGTGYEAPKINPGTYSWNIIELKTAQRDHSYFILETIPEQLIIYHYSEERAMHCAHTRAYMHTFDGVHPKYALEAVGVNYTFGAVGPLRVCCTLHINVKFSYVHNL